MSIIKRNNDMLPFYSSLLDEFLNTGMLPSNNIGNDQRGVPAINVKENDKEIALDVRVPGMKKEDIHLDYKDGFLTISGEVKEEKETEEKKGKFLRHEFSTYSFLRTVEVPNAKYDIDNTCAVYQNGILTITIPKNKEEEKVQKSIEIK